MLYIKKVIWHVSVFNHHIPVFQACTLARRNAEVFLKYIHRNNVSMPGAASHTRGPEQQVKGQSS